MQASFYWVVYMITRSDNQTWYQVVSLNVPTETFPRNIFHQRENKQQKKRNPADDTLQP